MIVRFGSLGMALLLAIGCATPSSLPRPPEAATTLRVTNQAYLDMTIYVVSGGQPTRLGIVTGNSTATLVIPARLINGPTTLRFQADPIGATRAPVTEQITVAPGDEVGLEIPPG